MPGGPGQGQCQGQDANSTGGRAGRIGIGAVQSILLLIALVLLFSIFSRPTPAAADLRVTVGYSMGPYYEKAYLSSGDVAAISEGPYEYSFITHGPFLAKGYGTGPQVRSLIDISGVDTYALDNIYFYTYDSYVSDNGIDNIRVKWSYSNFTNPRYYYPSLIDHWNFNASNNNQGGTATGIYEDGYDEVWSSGMEVPAILASSSYFMKMGNKDDPNWQFNASNMRSDGYYRLLFGQTVPEDSAAYDSANMVNAVACVLRGKPVINFDVGDLEGGVGDEFTIMPELLADDPLIAEQGLKDIKYKSDDESIATVTKNSDGSITIRIVGEGSALIGATFGNDSRHQAQTNLGVNRTGDGPGTGGSGDGPGSGIGGDGLGDGDGSDLDGSGGTGGTDNQEQEGSGTDAPEGSEQSEGSELPDNTKLTPINPQSEPDPDLILDSPEAAVEIGDDQAPLSTLAGNAQSGAAGEMGGQVMKLVIKANEPEFADQELRFDANSLLAYGLGVGGLFCLGGLYRVGHFELSRDPFQPRRRLSLPKRAKVVTLRV
jgi:hypothetical protein